MFSNETMFRLSGNVPGIIHTTRLAKSHTGVRGLMPNKISTCCSVSINIERSANRSLLLWWQWDWWNVPANTADYLSVCTGQNFIGTIAKTDFQTDGAPPYIATIAPDFLDETFKRKWIGRRGPTEWPPRSPDLTPLEFFLWGHLKSVVNKQRLRSSEQEWNVQESISVSWGKFRYHVSVEYKTFWS